MTDPARLAIAVTNLFEKRGYRFETGILGQDTIPPWLLAQPDAYLPVFLRLAEELWRQDTGARFGLRLTPDDRSLTGYRLTGLFHVPASIALLAVDALLERLATDGVLTFEALAREVLRVTA